jgi:hypothetical protein
MHAYFTEKRVSHSASGLRGSQAVGDHLPEGSLLFRPAEVSTCAWLVVEGGVALIEPVGGGPSAREAQGAGAPGESAEVRRRAKELRVERGEDGAARFAPGCTAQPPRSNVTRVSLRVHGRCTGARGQWPRGRPGRPRAGPRCGARGLCLRLVVVPYRWRGAGALRPSAGGGKGCHASPASVGRWSAATQTAPGGSRAAAPAAPHGYARPHSSRWATRARASLFISHAPAASLGLQPRAHGWLAYARSPRHACCRTVGCG